MIPAGQNTRTLNLQSISKHYGPRLLFCRPDFPQGGFRSRVKRRKWTPSQRGPSGGQFFLRFDPALLLGRVVVRSPGPFPKVIVNDMNRPGTVIVTVFRKSESWFLDRSLSNLSEARAIREWISFFRGHGCCLAFPRKRMVVNRRLRVMRQRWPIRRAMRVIAASDRLKSLRARSTLSAVPWANRSSLPFLTSVSYCITQ